MSAITTKALPAPASERDEWVLNLLPVVRAIAFDVMRTIPVHIEADDLIAAGVCGLVDAAKKFRTDKGANFDTYARYRIRGAILDSLREIDWAPRDSRQLYKRMQAAVNELTDELLRSPTQEEIAAKLGVSLSKFERMSLRLRSACLPILSLSYTELRSKTGDLLPGDAPCQRQWWPDRERGAAELQEAMAAALARLPRRYQLVIEMYYRDELTMREIGKHLHVNESRISQMHAWALDRLRAVLHEWGIESPGAFQTAA